MGSIIDLAAEPLHRLVGRLEGLLEGKLWRKVVAGLVGGVLVGFLIGPELGWVAPSTSKLLVQWFAFPGQLFLVGVQMIVVPLVFASIVSGLAASDDTDTLRALGLRAGLYFTLTSTIAISLGLACALLLRPGNLIDREMVGDVVDATQVKAMGIPGLAEIPQTLVGILPKNPLDSLVSGEMLQIVLFAFVVGVSLVVMPVAKSAPLLSLLESVQGVCMTVVQWAMRLAPLAVFGLSIQLTATLGLDALLGMLAYVGTVILGLMLLMIAYVALAAVIGRRSPGKFLGAARDVQLLAFSTSSSATVMPLSMKTVEEQLDVRPAMARFVIPLGATINMDGTALYQGVATVFLAQVYGVELGVAALALVVFTAVAASIGAPAAPGVGIVILAGVLENAGIPASGVALLIGVDRLLDMLRTSVNVTGDLTASVVLDRWLADAPGGAAEPAVATEPAPVPAPASD